MLVFAQQMYNRSFTVWLLLTLAGAMAAFWIAHAYFKMEEIDRASARLSLYRSTLEAELERFSHLTFILARDPFVIETARGANTSPLDARLAKFAERAGIEAIYLMDADGQTRSASNAGTAGSFVGHNSAFRPYFKSALLGVQGRFYGIGATTGIPGYFYADAVVDEAADVLGVIALKIDLSDLQESWRRADERVLLANADGVVLLASVPEWRYRTLAPLTDGQRVRIADARQFGTKPLDALDWSPTGRQVATIGGEALLHLQSASLPNDWSMHYFASGEQAVTHGWLAAGGFLLLAALTGFWVQLQRTRKIDAALRRSEEEEAQLRLANRKLATEIKERRAAERQLQRTQAELERAGRLAALGRLAVSVTHELGQPITAMRNHLAAAEMQGDSGALTSRLKGLVDRMEGIARQLKFFARNGKEEFEVVDLRDAMQAALDLVASDLKANRVTLAKEWPDGPAELLCNRLRMEQVMTNLMRNALDAMADADRRELTLGIDRSDGEIRFSVADTGHGFGEMGFCELSEPFATTRESGRGTGLGLAISSAIVEDHGGWMAAEARPAGGTVIRVGFRRERTQ